LTYSKFQIPFDQLKHIQELTLDDGSFQLVISLGSPPQFHRKKDDAQDGHSPDSLTWSEFSDGWYRQTDIVYNPWSLHNAVITLHKDRPVIDIGRWTTYLFDFQGTRKVSEPYYKELKEALQDYNLSVIPLKSLTAQSPRPAELWSLVEQPKIMDDTLDLKHLEVTSKTIYLPFEVRYQLEVCISREILNEFNISREFITKLAAIASVNPARARSILEYIADKGERIYEPLTIFDDQAALQHSPKTEVPYYCAYSRKATITPSTIYFSSPTVETTNRVLRHFWKENKDGRFLRVQFTDEFFEVSSPFPLFH
jgi:RNA-dependent RNA polymerase